MAINDNATLVIGAGNYFIGEVGEALPADLLNPGGVDPEVTTWENIGHTSLEDILSIASEGGEATIIGSLQNKTLRTKYSPRTETMAVVLQQFDEAGLRLYYGDNMEVLTEGALGVPTEPEPTRAAFLAVFTDGDKTFAFYAPLAEIFRNEDLELADTESMAGLPLGVKPLPYQSNKWAYAVTPLV